MQHGGRTANIMGVLFAIRCGNRRIWNCARPRYSPTRALLLANQSRFLSGNPWPQFSSSIPLSIAIDSSLIAFDFPKQLQRPYPLYQFTREAANHKVKGWRWWSNNIVSHLPFQYRDCIFPLYLDDLMFDSKYGYITSLMPKPYQIHLPHHLACIFHGLIMSFPSTFL